jgi:hypothetical protein
MVQKYASPLVILKIIKSLLSAVNPHTFKNVTFFNQLPFQFYIIQEFNSSINPHNNTAVFGWIIKASFNLRTLLIDCTRVSMLRFGNKIQNHPGTTQEALIRL